MVKQRGGPFHKGGSRLDPQGGACPRASRRLDPGDAGKKVTGRKRHILVDTLGLLLSVVVHPADVQDRDGARDGLAHGAPPVPLHQAHLRQSLPRT